MRNREGDLCHFIGSLSKMLSQMLFRLKKIQTDKRAMKKPIARNFHKYLKVLLKNFYLYFSKMSKKYFHSFGRFTKRYLLLVNIELTF